MSDQNDNVVHVHSKFGDLQVVVFLPGTYSQSAYSFRPEAADDGLQGTDKRDLMIIRAMLQDALDDIDAERHRRQTQLAEPAGQQAIRYHYGHPAPYVPSQPNGPTP